MRLRIFTLYVPLVAALTISAIGSAAAGGGGTSGGITFTDIAAGGAAGIVYGRTPSARNATLDAVKADGAFSAAELPNLPLKARGAPGVAVLDFDRDGDLDLYVTNGPGTDNSLYSNQWLETGQLTFIDVAVAAGVAAHGADSTGVCYGDIDNDGDHDLLVLSFNAPHALFENLGNGTFGDISAQSQLTFLEGAMSCAMGDVDGDGLLDIAIANLSNIENLLAFAVDPLGLNTPNQLFLNMGDHEFADVSGTSGIRDLDGVQPGAATLTWAVSIVDYDRDGDQDILFADDQAGFPSAADGGVDRGYVQVLTNDGTGQFSAKAVGTLGEWMGLSFGDLNCDGHMDFFGSNFGDYGLTPAIPTYMLGDSASRWFLGGPGGTFTDPGVGGLVATPFGWGTSMLDYDNDGDQDVMFHGGMDLITTIELSNAGALLQNQDCGASFTRATAALAGSADHGRRNVQGSAVGDLNNDGFVDMVSVSSFDTPAAFSTTPYATTYGSVFDADAFFVEVFTPAPGDPTLLLWNSLVFPDGTLSVEINSADNGNHWIAVDVMGTIGITPGGTVNRDGIGAVVTFTPKNGRPSMQPILGGSSYASQDSLTANFGLGDARQGTVEVLWPGGTRNRLDKVRQSERLLFPEIPCSFDGDWEDREELEGCVEDALAELEAAGILDGDRASDFERSMLRAFDEAHDDDQDSDSADNDSDSDDG